MKKLAVMAMIAMVMPTLIAVPVVDRRESKSDIENLVGARRAGAHIPEKSEKDIDRRTDSGARSPSSDLVHIGNDRKMYLECSGIGSPTVILISGFRGAHDDWTHIVDPANPTGAPIPSSSAVFHEVSRFTRVCAYDRPGTVQFGGAPTTSSAVPQPTTAVDGAADLSALLAAAGEQGPFVVVAHSWGGLMARVFANRNFSKVRGLVLLDPGSEFLETFLTPSQWAKFISAPAELGVAGDLELPDYPRSVAALRSLPRRTAIPSMVLSSDRPFEFGAGGQETWPAWLAAQNGVASILNATHVTNTNSGHFIQGEQPQLVSKAVRQVVDAAAALEKDTFSGLVSIDEHRKLYLECAGTGGPTVVFISGGFEAGWISKYALSSTDLVLEQGTDIFSDGRGDVRKLDRAVFPTTAKMTRVCNYDRPNTTLGEDIELERDGSASTPGPQPHTVEADVADLHALLRAAKVPQPYVLVAHSYGGLITELYTRTYPNEVAGRVLIDVTNEFLLDTFLQSELDGLAELQPPTPGGERIPVLAALHSVRNARVPRAKPVFVFSADKPRNLEPEAMATLQRVRASHELLAAQLCAKFMKRTNSGHHIFAEQPQLVNDAIQEVVEAVRQGCTTIPCNGVPPKTDASITIPACALRLPIER